MNKWDRIFWMLFVLLEIAVILGSVWFYSPALFIVGFVIIVAGFSKVGEHVRHQDTRHELLKNREKMEKMTNWLNSQYELTQGIKNLHDHRLHKMDMKRADIEGTIDKKYTELAGKMIDIENRLSLVSRALLSQTQKAPVAVENAIGRTADAVWKDITKLAGKKTISTLSRGIKNSILKVRPDRIVLRSEMTNTERSVLKEEFDHFWNILSKQKKLRFPHDIKEPQMVRAGSIIVSFLARLPYIEHSIKPRVLHLVGSDTHALGTLKVYGKTI
jgi:hypothetical protein